MARIVSFRPGVVRNNTAFEAQALIYKYLQNNYGYNFVIVKSEEDDYSDSLLKTVSISSRLWQINPYELLSPLSYFKLREIKKLLTDADGILTLDPIVYPQGLAAIKIASDISKPIWFDSSSTTMNTSKGIAWKLRKRIFIEESIRYVTGIILTVPKCIERFQYLDLLSSGSIASKFVIMGHPVDTQRFLPMSKLSNQDGILRIIVVSRMVPEKGVIYTYQALAPILKSRRDVQLTFVGSGPIKSFLEREIKESGLCDRIACIESIPHEYLPSFMGTADLFISHPVTVPYWEEFFGVANLEAMSCGLPCIVTANGGISYVIRNKGIAEVVEERNIVNLQESVTQFLDSAEKRKQYGQRAREYVEQEYALPAIGDKFHKMLQSGFLRKNVD